MNVDELIAIDTHTHAEVSCWNPFDSYGEEYDRAADKYFRSNRRPTIDERIGWQALATGSVAILRVALVALGAWASGEMHVILYLLLALVQSKIFLGQAGCH